MKLHTLARMSPCQKDDAITALLEASHAPRNGQMKWADAKVAAFEAKHGMTTAEMRAGFKAGAVPDTADIAQWLILAPR